MAVLHNRVSQKELKERLFKETEPRTTLSFYRYFPLEDPKLFRDQLYKALDELAVFGRIYVAREGINAQISIPTGSMEDLVKYLNSLEALRGLRLNIALDNDGKSFWVLKIKVRDKIVSDGITDDSFDMRNKGKYIDAQGFNLLTEDPSTVVVDMRNHYEYEVGHFDGALELPSDTFREQLPMAVAMLADHKDKNIIMYCTGGIRCEKASAYLLHHGFERVFHLQGGIIEYANAVKQNGLPNKFRGKNFVFDNRLGEKIGEQIISRCHQCGEPCDTHVNCQNEGCHLLFIQCALCAKIYQGCCSETCEQTLGLDPVEKKAARKGINKGHQVFNKSRHRLKSKPEK
jgi:UPF0176 protein